MTEEKGAKGKLTREDLDIIKEALLEAAKEDMFQQLIQAKVSEAVAEAMAGKEEEMRELREELDDTKTRLNELEQYSRRLCLNVSGVPEAPGEDTNQIVTDLAKMAGVNVAPRDLDVSHRVGASREGKARAIIVRFTHYTARQAVYDARRELRKPRPFRGSVVTAETAHGVFVSDSLTRDNQQLLYRARQLKREQKIFAAWSDVGKLKLTADPCYWLGELHARYSERPAPVALSVRVH
ncbi:hypothetical protein FJT64_014444 [Amphibalanus amphitrite]|uniref:Uncharacterized protein n=1 Tax=Amphibalanus amphitrite TaxID=1232801 RepID=A0A6A4V7C7_AMPAM|nr:hypothetical protein FJT64_014444 [Amphibalanus amphitrite]